MRVEIDGVSYMPEKVLLTDTALGKLSEAYSIAWANGIYDPVDRSKSSEYLAEVARLLMDANKELHFKR
jgi:intein-encoded DNA endonuclease-like protein